MKISKQEIQEKISELRRLKIYTKEFAYPKKISDDLLVETLFILLNSKGIKDKFYFIEDTDVDFSYETISKDFVKNIVDKYQNEPFNLQSVLKKVQKQAGNITGIYRDLDGDIVTSTYWIDKQNIFPDINFHDKVNNYRLRNEIISETIEMISKRRNLKNAFLAKRISHESLIGKFVVTENNVLSGFVKNSMVLKYVGYLPGKIMEVRYGARHGLDNFWDDHVGDRHYLVIEIENSTKAKEIDKWQEKKYTIDLTETLQVFETMDEALSVAGELNNFYKKSLTLDY